jgi:hypothetical protein
MKKITTLFIMVIMTASVWSQSVLFEDNFDDGIGATRWTVVEQGTSNTFNLAFDYIADGLAAAPNGGGKGFKIIVNETEGAASQVLAFPTGYTFTNKFTLSFDCWMNWTGDAGTTEFALFGIQHTDELVPNYTGIDLALTGDGGASRDVRLYVESTEITIDATVDPDTTAVYPAGTQDFFVGAEYYAPVIGIGDDVYAGMQWLEVDVIVTDDLVEFYVNDVLFAKYPKLASDGNVLIGYMDLFSSLAGELNNWIVYDNVVVTDNTTGISSITADFSASLYPNPANNELNVEVQDRSTFELYNTIGQMVYSSFVDGKSTIDVSNFNNGMYIAKVTSGNGQVEIHKIMIK